MTTALGPIDHSLRHRANLVVPGGMYGHMRAGGLPEGYPQFFARGEGWDLSCSGIAIPPSMPRRDGRWSRATA
jgi:hypothetical protein